MSMKVSSYALLAMVFGGACLYCYSRATLEGGHWTLVALISYAAVALLSALIVPRGLRNNHGLSFTPDSFGSGVFLGAAGMAYLASIAIGAPQALATAVYQLGFVGAILFFITKGDQELDLRTTLGLLVSLLAIILICRGS